MSSERPNPSGSFSLEQVIGIASQVLLHDGYHQPTLIVEGSERNLIAHVADLANTHAERMQQIYTTGFALGKRGMGMLAQVFFISEAWVSRREGEQSPILPPSADPNRKEALVVANFDITKENMQVVILEMIRDPNGTLQELKQETFDTPPEPQIDSPLIRMFVAGFMAAIRDEAN